MNIEYNNEKKFLNCIVTRNDMWVHYAEPEKKSSVKAVETNWFPISQEV